MQQNENKNNDSVGTSKDSTEPKSQKVECEREQDTKGLAKYNQAKSSTNEYMRPSTNCNK